MKTLIGTRVNKLLRNEAYAEGMNILNIVTPIAVGSQKFANGMHKGYRLETKSGKLFGYSDSLENVDYLCSFVGMDRNLDNQGTHVFKPRGGLEIEPNFANKVRKVTAEKFAPCEFKEFKILTAEDKPKGRVRKARRAR